MGPVRMVRRWLGLAVAALAVAGPISAHPADAHATPVRQAYLQFNMCGNACNHGGLAVVHNLEHTIAADRPVAVTLNEVCENQYERLRRDLPGYAGRFDPTGPVCGNGTRYGNAVLVHGSGLDVLGGRQLPNPAGDETRRLLCVRGHPAGAAALVVCVTHISFVAGNIAAQIDAVAGYLRGLPGGEAILLGGDFNTDPGDARLDPVYSNRYDAGTGSFTEADSAASHSRMGTGRRPGADGVNETTFAKTKLDYIFLADGHWSAARATVVDAGGGLSDHGALLATTTVTDR
jgi:endonuclease/exonuclease/phosphatase family metal-dependent hydrolase